MLCAGIVHVFLANRSVARMYMCMQTAATIIAAQLCVHFNNKTNAPCTHLTRLHPGKLPSDCITEIL